MIGTLRMPTPAQGWGVYGADTGDYAGKPLTWSVMSRTQKIAWLKGAIARLSHKKRTASRAKKLQKYKWLLQEYIQRGTSGSKKAAEDADLDAQLDTFDTDDLTDLTEALPGVPGLSPENAHEP